LTNVLCSANNNAQHKEAVMHDADKKAASYAGYVECYLLRNARSECTMTDATEAIWGTSGRGSPNAVRVIEAVADWGYLRVEQRGKRKRIVYRTDKPIPEAAFSAEDRAWALEQC
jgi:hypothetical protein